MTEQFTYLDSEACAKRVNVLSELVVETYAHSAPWHTRPSFTETVNSFKEGIQRYTIHAICVSRGDTIVGLTLFGQAPDYAIITNEAYGPTMTYRANLLKELNAIMENHHLAAKFALTQTVVDHRFQQQGIGTRLRAQALLYIQEQYPIDSLVFTHLSSNNNPIIHSSRSLGFTPLGMSYKSEDTSYTIEPWYKPIFHVLPNI